MVGAVKGMHVQAELSVMIANIANISVSRGEFPSMMKSGLVSPLLKKPGLDSSDCKNFRLITNLSTISKLLERLPFARLKSQIISSPNYCNLQSAYCSEHSTETALFNVMDDIYRAVDYGFAVVLVGLDVVIDGVEGCRCSLRRRQSQNPIGETGG